MSRDERFMREALAVARSVPTASPNPRVGAVVVKDDHVIGRGTHRGPGTPHAEVVALRGIDARDATLYVTLEPCSFLGRTPPCAPAVIEAGISRVVIAMEDPDRRVHGRGIAMLREAGVEVELGLLEKAARELNAAFIHHRTTGLPFLVLKLALTLDGKLAASDGSSRWITSSKVRERVHEERSRSDAILVGLGTIEADDPQLSVRLEGEARQPARVVVDATGRLRPSAKVFSSNDTPLLVATTDAASQEVQTAWKEAGAEVLVLEASNDGVDLGQLLRELGARDLLQVLCEGGAKLATSLLKEDRVDRLELHYGSKMVGGSGPQIGDLGTVSMKDSIRWTITNLSRMDDDVLMTLERTR